jgi:transposase
LVAIARRFELATHPQRKVVLFVDNDKTHDAKPVRELLTKYADRSQLEWLPPYSPELNPQVDIWQPMRRQVIHNHYFEEIDALLEAIAIFPRNLESDPDKVLLLIK